MVRAGRQVIDDCAVVKVVRDAKADETRVDFANGTTSTFKKYGKAVWNHFKGAAEVTLTA